MGQHQALSARVHQQKLYKLKGAFIKHEETTLFESSGDVAIVDATSDPVHGIRESKRAYMATAGSVY